MTKTQTPSPPAWRAALAKSDLEIARGDLVSAQSIHEELHAAITELEAEAESAASTASR